MIVKNSSDDAIFAVFDFRQYVQFIILKHFKTILASQSSNRNEEVFPTRADPRLFNVQPCEQTLCLLNICTRHTESGFKVLEQWDSYLQLMERQQKI